MEPPVLRLPDPVREDLDAHRAGLAAEFEAKLRTHARPCVRITSTRAADAPLRRSSLTKLFGAREAEPRLSITASKFGGTPYLESEEDWREHMFLGQLDLDVATAVLPTRLSGLLRIDVSDVGRTIAEGFRVRWFASPDASRVVAARPHSFGAWETQLSFGLAWSLPEGPELEAMWPLEHPQWFDYDRFLQGPYDLAEAEHRLLGHKSSAVFDRSAGLGGGLADYEQLLALTFDRAAGFHWGSSSLYLLVPREDLARGDLSRIVVTGA